MKTGTVAHLYPLLSITYPPTIGLIAYPIDSDVVNKEDRIAVVDGLSVYPSFLVNIEKKIIVKNQEVMRLLTRFR